MTTFKLNPGDLFLVDPTKNADKTIILFKSTNGWYFKNSIEMTRPFFIMIINYKQLKTHSKKILFDSTSCATILFGNQLREIDIVDLEHCGTKLNVK